METWLQGSRSCNPTLGKRGVVKAPVSVWLPRMCALISTELGFSSLEAAWEQGGEAGI